LIHGTCLITKSKPPYDISGPENGRFENGCWL